MIHRRSFLASMASTLAARLDAAPSKPPNIVFILCDDLGYGDLGCYGSKIPTPNLDRMAAAGVRFTNFSSADPVCSPSRAALLTGRYPTRVGVPHVFFPQDKGGMNLDEVTLANVLKNRGYRTICIGKWHLGRPVEYLPTSRGFDEYFGIPYSNDMNPRVLMHNTEVIEQETDLSTLTPRYTEQAIRFIRENRGSPMFLFLPQTYPHIPLGASERFRGKSPEGLYGDVVQEIDWSVGEIRRALKENGLEQNTLVIFTSDNGPWYQGSPGKLRGRKNTTYEGGVREPFIAAWPGKIPANRVCDGLASMLDMFPDHRAAMRSRAARETAGRHRYLASVDGTESIHRSRGLTVFRRLGSAMRALDELEIARSAAQHRRLHAGAARRTPQLFARAS